MKGLSKILLGALLAVFLSGSFLLAGAFGPDSRLASIALATCAPACSSCQGGVVSCIDQNCNQTTTSCSTSAGSTTTTPTTTSSGDASIPILSGIADFFGNGLQGLVSRIVQFLMQSVATILVGNNPPATAQYAPQNIQDVYDRFGALGALGLGVQTMYNHPPITTLDFLATIHPIAPVLADQTSSISGRQVLSPLLAYWETSRNLAYIFFVVILTTIGLMIMFRSKIDPRTTVSVTAALPNLVVSLVLITFSLAFAGFVIDLGRVLMELAKSVALGAVAGGSPLPGVDPTFNDNLLSPGGIWKVFVVGTLFGNVGSFGGFGGAVVGVFLRLIIAVFAFIIGIQVFLMLLQRYVNLLIKPILAPFVFLFAALPGRGGSIGSWFKGYFVDAATFALVFMVLLLALSIRKLQIGSIGQDPFGLFIGGADLTTLVSLYVVFLATKIPAILEEALDVKPSSHVDRSGAQPGSMLKQVPIIKTFIK